MDAETAERYGAIVHALRTAGTPIPTNDLWIAASAMQHGLRVLTTDAHYNRVAQILVEFFGRVTGLRAPRRKINHFVVDFQPTAG